LWISPLPLQGGNIYMNMKILELTKYNVGKFHEASQWRSMSTSRVSQKKFKGISGQFVSRST
jgi:hypothetical protein